MSRLGDLDRSLFEALARRDPPLLDATMPPLTRAADRSKLWLAVAAVLAVVPSRRSRRAARRGLLSVAASSAVVNVLAKRVFRRRRPDLRRVPVRRHARRVPTSSSFPSGHAASAAAFAVGVGVEAPALAAPVGLLAAAVAYSRVHTGVHYPVDVVAGAAVGATVAAVGARVFPKPPPPEPPSPRSRVQLAPIADGEGVTAVVNPGSGPRGADAGVVGRLRRDLPRARVVEMATGDDLVEVLRREAADAAVLGIYGGDGSVNAAAAVAMEHDLPLLVLPGGTLNHFARDLGLDGVSEAVAALVAGTAARVDVGEVDGRIFLNTASLGSYPSFVAIRERWQKRIGKGPAAVVATAQVLKQEQALPARVDGHRRALAALFVGVGRYEPDGALPSRRPRMDTGVLDARYLDVGGRAWRLITFVELLARQDRFAGGFEHVVEPELVLQVDGPTLLARDGEIGPVAGPTVRFRARPAALTVYRSWSD